ncbi:MAG: tRNA pseudouridine(13) synthase TruD [Halioglobus sp.]
MQINSPPAWGEPVGRAVIRACPENFIVHEQLGFEPSGEGEHVFLHLEKRLLTTLELQERIASFCAVPAMDIGFCGMKDRNAVTRQWFSVRLAGKTEPDWQLLSEDSQVSVLSVQRHLRKLKRGVHRANNFQLRLSTVQADVGLLEARLQTIREQGVPNYFGPQRFGRGGNTLVQARRWQSSGQRKITRKKRSLYLSALRSWIFNEMLTARVQDHNWNTLLPGDYCMLQGSRSRFAYSADDTEVHDRLRQLDIHPGLPLWGSGAGIAAQDLPGITDEMILSCKFLEQEGLEVGYRATRLMADDFCWEFCDDGSLHLQFSLVPGGYATAILAELTEYSEGEVVGGDSGE